MAEPSISSGWRLPRRWLLAGLLLAGSALSLPVFGVTAIDGFDFENAADAARYQRLIAEFRCPKCLNTNLSGSDAPIAADLRRTVRRLVLEGQTDQAVRDYLQARYGDFVLYNPPMAPRTWLLWFTPVVLILVGLIILRRIGVRRESVELTPEERRRLAEITGRSQ